jgi:putative lipoic acid-binding regulatory protein
MSDESPRLSPAAERERAIALLEATHQFPVVYELSVISLSAPDVFIAVRVAAGLSEAVPSDDDENHQMLPSRGGKYMSHRLKVACETADHVLELYARLRSVTGVVTLL